jgi:hypothetical protein
MIGVRVNGRFLDLKPRSSGEVERKSPFFSIEEITSEASTPLTFLYTPNNAVALKLPYQYYTERKKMRLPAEYFDDNTFKGRCTLVLETGKLNLNNVEATEISGYLLYGVSNFLNDIKGAKLSDLSYGGDRTFNWTTADPTDGSDGFWQHIHDSWTDAAIPYVFQPIRNEGWLEDVDWLNKLDDNAKIKYDLLNVLVPAIRLPFLIENIFSDYGYTVDFSGMGDTHWQKLIMLSEVEVNWVNRNYLYNGSNESWSAFYTVWPSITINLQNHVPQDKTIADFIIQLFNRYGWFPIFDLSTKVVKMYSVKAFRSGRKKTGRCMLVLTCKAALTKTIKFTRLSTTLILMMNFRKHPILATLFLKILL